MDERKRAWRVWRVRRAWHVWMLPVALLCALPGCGAERSATDASAELPPLQLRPAPSADPAPEWRRPTEPSLPDPEAERGALEPGRLAQAFAAPRGAFLLAAGPQPRASRAGAQAGTVPPDAASERLEDLLVAPAGSGPGIPRAGAAPGAARGGPVPLPDLGAQPQDPSIVIDDGAQPLEPPALFELPAVEPPPLPTQPTDPEGLPHA